MTRQKAMLIDIKRCIGCLSCETACKQLHGFSTDPEPTLSDTAFTVVETRGDKFVRKICMHCEEPACASACPVGAISKSALGPVVYNADKCIGCRYCMLACPYSGAALSMDEARAVRQEVRLVLRARSKPAGSQPARRRVPVQASIFGNRDQMIAEAWNRIRSDSSYVPRILRPGGSRWGQRVLHLRRAVREAGIQARAHWQPAHANAHRQRAR